jgi:hypothetical protein
MSVSSVHSEDPGLRRGFVQAAMRYCGLPRAIYAQHGTSLLFWKSWT